MKRSSIAVSLAVGLFLSALGAAQDAKKPGVLGAQEVKKLVPAAYYFAGQSGAVQARNSVGFRTASGKTVLAGLMDTTGYASDIQQKFQGFLITETKLKVGGAELPPGQYGFGFTKDGKFVVMDVGSNDLLSVTAASDDKLAHPVPLKMTADGGAYKLYGGKQWVALQP